MANAPVKRNVYKRRFKKRRGINTARQVRAIVNNMAEKKVYRDAISSNTDWNGTITDICDMIQGDANNERLGDSVYLQSFNLRTHFSASSTNQIIRFIVFQWLDDDVPVPSSILNSSQVGTLNAPLAPYDVDKHNATFKVLSTKTYQITNGSNGNSQGVYSLYIKGNMKPYVQFQKTTTVGTNKIYLLTITNDTAINSIPVNGITALRYTDL